MDARGLFRIVLDHPEIPSNTGNIIRLCANTGAELHLIEPLGFHLDDAKLRRAGLDYRDRAALHIHASWDEFLSTVKPPRVFACSTRGRRTYSHAAFQTGDTLLFGSTAKTSSPHRRRVTRPAVADAPSAINYSVNRPMRPWFWRGREARRRP